MTDFLELQNQNMDSVIFNTLTLFRNNDLGSKIDISITRETKKTQDEPEPDAPLQQRLRLANRFNMDLNNVYAVDVYPSENGGLHVETSVNVYHDNFNQDEFTAILKEVFCELLHDVDFQFLMNRLDHNFRNAFSHWKAAAEKKFIRDPQVDALKIKHQDYSEFHRLTSEEIEPLRNRAVHELLPFDTYVVLEKRKIAYARSKILKVKHLCPPEAAAIFKERPHVLSMLLLEHCLVPLYLTNELYVMSLIYKRNMEEIQVVLRKRVLEC